VVPARIAAVSSTGLAWTLYTLADKQLRVKELSASAALLGAVTQADLSTRTSIAELADAGTRLTELRVDTVVPDNDLVLEPDPAQADYRRVEYKYVYVECTGGNGGEAGASETGGAPLPTGGKSSQDPMITGGGGSVLTGTGGTTHTGGARATGGGTSEATGGSGSPIGDNEGDCSCRLGRPRAGDGLHSLLAAALAGALAAARRRRSGASRLGRG